MSAVFGFRGSGSIFVFFIFKIKIGICLCHFGPKDDDEDWASWIGMGRNETLCPFYEI